jgi:hypothetical protein
VGLDHQNVCSRDGRSVVMIIGTIRELMRGHLGAEIVCAYRGQVVRKLVVNPDVNIVDIDFGDGEVIGLDLDTELHYESWMMDRGSITFRIPDHLLRPDMSPGVQGKFCTEFDIMRFDDGTEESVQQ